MSESKAEARELDAANAWVAAQSEALGARLARIAAGEGAPADLRFAATATALLVEREAEAWVRAGKAAAAWLALPPAERYTASGFRASPN